MIEHANLITFIVHSITKTSLFPSSLGNVIQLSHSQCHEKAHTRHSHGTRKTQKRIGISLRTMWFWREIRNHWSNLHSKIKIYLHLSICFISAFSVLLPVSHSEKKIVCLFVHTRAAQRALFLCVCVFITRERKRKRECMCYKKRSINNLIYNNKSYTIFTFYSTTCS
jgi:hypothetical protein